MTLPTRTTRRLAPLSLVLVSACAPGLSNDQVATSANYLRDNPASRAAFVAECQRREEGRAAAGIAYNARVMGVAPAAAPRVLCERLTKALIEGRLDAADLTSPATGGMSPRLMQAIRNG